MSTAPRYSGVLAVWIEADGFGEIEPDGHHARVVVRRQALATAGIDDPAAEIGAGVTFEIGSTGSDGPTGAVAVQRVAPTAAAPTAARGGRRP